MPNIELLNIDCMEYMAGLPDNAFDLAIVDPPYFKDYAKKNYTGNDISTTGIKRQTKKINYWEVPNKKYFDELYRISNHQIIWGCNYYERFIPFTGRIIWDKKNDTSTFSKAEIAGKSINIGIDMFRYMWNGMIQEKMGDDKEIRIHPTQKPVQLYKWLLSNYAKPGDKILDTHGGSMSIAIACHDLCFDLVCCEKDKDYYDAAVKRYNDHIKQLKIEF